MPGVLRNAGHERFARAWVEQAMSPRPPAAINNIAYEQAGYVPSMMNSSRMRRIPEIEARINELMEEALEYSDIRIARAAIRLDRIASATITDFREGRRWRDIDTLPARLADAVRRVDYYEDGSIKQIELHDKVRALSLLMKHLGGLPDEQPGMQMVNNTLNVNITDEQRVAALMTMLARAKSSGGEAP